jgi:hypothetical protein
MCPVRCRKGKTGHIKEGYVPGWAKALKNGSDKEEIFAWSGKKRRKRSLTRKSKCREACKRLKSKLN